MVIKEVRNIQKFYLIKIFEWQATLMTIEDALLQP